VTNVLPVRQTSDPTLESVGGAAKIAPAGVMAAREAPIGQDLSSGVPPSRPQFCKTAVLIGISQTVCCGRGHIRLTAAAVPTHHKGMRFHASVPLLLDGKVVERDWVDSMIANLACARDRLEEYIGRGNAKYLLIGLLAVLLLMLVRRRR